MVELKRSNKDDDVETFAMANCMMLISHMDEEQLAMSGRVYECKTCRKKFPSFQALGGHRASHRRPRILGDNLRAKKHVCPVCGMEFERGQALGGHMSKHRSHGQQLPQHILDTPEHTNNNRYADHNQQQDSGSTVVVKEQPEEDTSSDSIKEEAAAATVVLSWDLNLTPSQNEINDASERLPGPSIN